MFNCNISLFMNKKIITGFLMFALAVFSMSSFVACKDYDEDSYDDLKARINKQITLTDAIQNQIAELEKKLNNIKSCTCDPSKYASQEEFEKALKRIADLEEAIKNIKSCTCEGGGGGDTTIYITNPYDDEWIKIKFGEIEDQLKILNTLNAWQIYIENRIDSIANAIYGWDTTIYNLNYKVDSILKWLEINTDTTIIGGGCDPDCKKKIAKAQETANDALYLAQQALLLAMENAGRLNDHETRISELENLVKTFVTKDELKEEIKKLNDRIDDLLDKMVTGIILQGTESPVIGYFNTPLDVRSQILAAYYGEVSSNVKFPATTSGDYVDASEFWTARNMEVIGSFTDKVNISGEFVSTKNGDTKGNAGKLYLTVNPAEVDFTGKVLSLESSTGDVAGVELEPLAVSEKELSFGYTRAYNGFYEAEATLTNIDKAKIRVDFKQLESQAKTMLKEKSKNSVLSFGAALMSSIKDVMPAYAVKATWTAPARTDAVGQKSYSVYSQYGLAAAAIKPFSYAFLKDLNVSFPSEEKLQDLVAEIINKIKININLNLPDFAKYKGKIVFTDITLPTIADDMFHVKYYNVFTTDDFVNEGELYGDAKPTNLYFLVTNDKNGKWALVEQTADGKTQLFKIYDETTKTWRDATSADLATWGAIDIHFTVDIDQDFTPQIKQTLQDIVDSLNKQYGASSDLAKTITDLLNDVASLGNIDTKINDAITDAKNDLKTQLQGYITKAYNKLNSIFSKTPNKALQPVLIGKSGDKIGLLSKSKKNPTKVNGSSLTLIPTSYTLELVAPAYKKYIVVSDVFKADGSLAEASIGKAANGENMNKIIDSEKTCTINGQSGYIYEISYNAVDYHGKIVNKRFYVQF